MLKLYHGSNVVIDEIDLTRSKRGKEETYKRLCNPACGLYYESAVYVFSYLENEIEIGIVK